MVLSTTFQSLPCFSDSIRSKQWLGMLTPNKESSAKINIFVMTGRKREKVDNWHALQARFFLLTRF